MIEIVTESNRIESFNAFYLRHTQPCVHCWNKATHVHNYKPIDRGGSPYDHRNVQALCDYHYEWAVTGVQPLP